MATLPLIQRAFASLPSTVTTYFFRADTACYDERTLQWLADPARPGGPRAPIGFTVGADLTKDLRAVCAAVPAARWALFEDRPDETVHCTEGEFTPGDWPKRAQPLRYVALRFQRKQGQLFAAGTDTKYLALVSNRWALAPAALVRWHWQKAGTIELVHDITKNELGAAVPPCGRFGANAAWYRLSLLTYNVLSALKSLALPPALSAPDVEHGPAEAPPLHALHPGWPAGHARGAAAAPGAGSGGAPRRVDRRTAPARPHRPRPRRRLIAAVSGWIQRRPPPLPAGRPSSVPYHASRHCQPNVRYRCGLAPPPRRLLPPWKAAVPAGRRRPRLSGPGLPDPARILPPD